MRKALWAVGIAATTLILGSGTAAAGGGTWFFEGQSPRSEAVLVPGDRVHAETLLWLDGVKRGDNKGAYWAGPKQGPFFGYISGQERQRWGPIAPPLPNHAMRVGEVRFAETEKPGVLDVSLDFTLPDLEPGYYMLHHCNVPCSRQIGDMMSTPFTVVEDRGQAFLASRVSRLDRQIGQLRPVLDNRTDNVRSENAALGIQIRSLENRIAALEENLTRAARRSAPSSGGRAPMEWIFGGALTALLAVIGLRSIRRGLGRRAEPNVG